MKKWSISALISGLLAAPAMAAPPAILQVEPGVPIVETAAVGFPVEMPDVRRQLKRVMAGKPLDAFGMQALRKKMAEEALRRMVGIRQRQDFYPVQLVLPNSGGGAGGAQAGTMMMPSTAKLEKAAFLGISTSPAPVMLRTQLNLPRGMGLVVDYVDKDSPAGGENGLKVYDVLQKFEDQVLVNPQQLAVLVRAKKAGDPVNLTVLREGKTITVTVKLVEKDVPPIEDLYGASGSVTGAPGAGVTGAGSGARGAGRLVFPESNTGQVITLSTSNEGKNTLVVKDLQGHVLYQGPMEEANLPSETMAKVRALAEQRNDLKIGTPGLNADVTSSLNRKDGEQDITLRTENGKQTLIVKDMKTGQTLYEGAADETAESKALSAGVMEKVKALSALGK